MCYRGLSVLFAQKDVAFYNISIMTENIYF